MSDVVDLNILFEKQKNVVKFNTKDGQEIVLEMHISPYIAMRCIQAVNDKKTEMESASILVSDMIKEQLNKDIEPDYILRNCDFAHLMYINNVISESVYAAMDIIKQENGSAGTTKKK